MNVSGGEKTQSATVSFEKATAAKTALMLNGGSLDGANISVTSEVEHTDEVEADHPEGTASPTIEQHQKPRAGIAAEYLAKGYLLSDSILQRAIDMDQKQGISKRFLNYLNSIDTTAGQKAFKPKAEGETHPTFSQGALAQAKNFDEQKGISRTATDYYTKAFSTPFGQKVKAFYSTTTKQVLDIHEEARRIADAQKSSQTAPAAATTEVPPAEK